MIMNGNENIFHNFGFELGKSYVIFMYLFHVSHWPYPLFLEYSCLGMDDGASRMLHYWYLEILSA